MDSTRQNRIALRMTLLCCLVLVLDGYDIGSMSFTIPLAVSGMAAAGGSMGAD